MTSPVRRLFLAGLLAIAAIPTARAEPTTVRFRGTVVRADSERLEIRRASGSSLAVQMGPRTRIYAVNGSSLRSIKPESYVSILGASESEPRQASAVTLYSPSERGFEAGSQPWDTGQGARLTAGWVADLQRGAPTRVTVAYNGGQSSFAIPDGTPVTQLSPGEKAMLQPGAAVTIFARSGDDGGLVAGTIAVGRQGVVPGL
ncbi:hypothetical protein ABID82_004928 [Methylobacterium sp. PvP062]|uniref:DUF5666 domain-containing protein n=1 Tax=Methylobacterium radiotolerans (strain ATCC 27329 / DSM 1819 / JCM 2831 / NBRC 15690 / NCIMB 10815 / 0-1) TaxID=426355 RepID=B1LXT1_METRJ|nr:conserved hypothetical protein [Methylobacterium radiotolerans JCM 2831]KTS12710.1 hypothetical protein SB3_00400 [Methylobacterium radiotolerans]MBN6824108.1 hypothetical protein [Methylobacterium organophilum]GAN49541.1 hypothetical protein ME121_3570 [Methylobacterium sp. ME121]KTS48404.1 hypothetical protein SB2_10565 [Methylobacterium radiotolerans]